MPVSASARSRSRVDLGYSGRSCSLRRPLPWQTMALVFATCVLHGCAAVHFEAAPDPRPIGPVVRVTADWDDLDAAIDVAAGVNQLALVRTVDPGPMHREFHMVTILDAPVIITARRPDANHASSNEADATRRESIDIELACTYGWSGDPGRESTILRAIAKRLRQLHGREYAPLNAPQR